MSQVPKSHSLTPEEHELNDELFLQHLYNAIVKDVDLKPNTVYNTEGSMNLFGKIRATVHSGDHDTHFHVILIAEGINARFSYPDIRLIDYISKNTYTSRQIKNIVVTCKIPRYFDFIGAELRKRND